MRYPWAVGWDEPVDRDGTTADLPTLRAGRWTDDYSGTPREAPVADPPESPETPAGRDRLKLVALGVALVVLGAATGYVATQAALDAHHKGGNVAVGPTDRDAGVLGDLIIQQSDVPADDVVVLVNNGTDTVNTATLDLCNGRYPSETLRTARLQVVVDGPETTTGMSTEAVLYRSPTGSAQAFGELRAVTAACPPRPVVSPVGEPTLTTRFNAPPDKGWPNTPSVQRLAYDLTTTEQGQSTRTIAVYLRRGRALMGIYFPSTGVQTAVDGKTTISDIVQIFARRVAALPPTVVNG